MVHFSYSLGFHVEGLNSKLGWGWRLVDLVVSSAAVFGLVGIHYWLHRIVNILMFLAVV